MLARVTIMSARHPLSHPCSNEWSVSSLAAGSVAAITFENGMYT